MFGVTSRPPNLFFFLDNNFLTKQNYNSLQIYSRLIFMNDANAL